MQMEMNMTHTIHKLVLKEGNRGLEFLCMAF